MYLKSKAGQHDIGILMVKTFSYNVWEMDLYEFYFLEITLTALHDVITVIQSQL